MPHGSPVSVVGSVVRRQQPDTSKGVVFSTLADETSSLNIIVYPALYESERNLVRYVRFLAIAGRLQKEYVLGGMRMANPEVMNLSTAGNVEPRDMG